MPQQFTYNKTEKLKSRKLLQQVFSQGKSFSQFPIKVLYKLVDEPQDFPVKVGVGVSSRNFKHAVDRNRIKRLLREAYRLNKQPLHGHLAEQNKYLAVFFLFTDKELPDNNLLQTKMPLAIEKLIKQL